MRSNYEIKKMIMGLAEQDDRIRAVVLQGSRANKNIIPDALQDYDVLFIVDGLETFISDHSWLDIFGEKIIGQLPDEMGIGSQENKTGSFHYLMLFTDGNRIDLTLFPKIKLETHFKMDSLSILWLDKDGLFPQMEKPGEKDWLIQKPTEKEFADCCNEFWWVSTYISKGLLRNDITYAKAMMEGPVRQMFMLMMAWFLGTETGFSVSFGKEGKNMKNLLDKDTYQRILETYPDYETENIWKSLFKMIGLFSLYSEKVSDFMQFELNRRESENVKKYLRQQFAERK